MALLEGAFEQAVGRSDSYDLWELLALRGRGIRSAKYPSSLGTVPYNKNFAAQNAKSAPFSNPVLETYQ